MIEITFSIPLAALYFGFFVVGLLIGALGTRWVYRPAPGRVRVPYLRPPVPPEPGRGYQPEPDYPRPPTPPAPPPPRSLRGQPAPPAPPPKHP